MVRKSKSPAGQSVIAPASVKPKVRLVPTILHLLSDSTGNLGNHMLAAFLTQFPADAFVLRRWMFLASSTRVIDTLDAIAEEPGIVFHAVVSPESKQIISLRCQQMNWPCCDLTGQFVDFLARSSGVNPTANVGRLHDMTGDYRMRIKGLEYTLEHDDGLRLDTLGEAEIILVGISRTSKTPTSIYLGQQGYKVANIALAHEVKPPIELLNLKGAKKVVGLLINPRTLTEIRTNRNVNWRMTDTSYNDPRHVAQEVSWSRELFAQQGWATIDVSDQAIEETAGRIVHMLGLKPPGG